MVQAVGNVSERITVGSRRIGADSKDLAQRTEEQAASLEETAATTEQLAASVKQSFERACEAATWVPPPTAWPIAAARSSARL